MYIINFLGAYLFKPDERQGENVPVFTDEDLKEVVIISGPVFSEVSVVYESGSSATSGFGTKQGLLNIYEQ